MTILLDENRSVWRLECPEYEPRRAPSADLVADVVVIGGGLTGVSAAHHLARRHPTRSVVLLEGRALGNGASGRNGGMVLNHLSGVHLPEEPSSARELYDVFVSTVDGMLATIDEHQLEAPLIRRGSVELLTDARRADAAARQVERWASGGLPLRFLPASELEGDLAVRGAAGAVLDPKAGQLNVLRYLRAMRAVLESLGVRVFENSVVQRLREGSTIEVETSHAIVRAKAVVLATNAYTPQLGYFADRLMALHSHVIATEPLGADAFARIGWSSRVSFSDDRGRLTYGSVSDAGRVVLGGGSNAAYGYRFGNRPVVEEVPAAGRRAMERRLQQCFGDAAELAVRHCWSGPLGITGSRVPIIGVLGEHRNVFFSLGYSGSGITAATLAGRVIADLYDDDAVRWNELPGVGRRGEWLPPEPFRWLGYALYTALTGRSRLRTYRG